MYYFKSASGLLIYVGKDKFENEKLIKHGWPEDIWFHVDDLSSAHVYVRLPRGPIRKTFRETGRLDHVPAVLEELCQLVKANSIEGSKKSSVNVVYTEWENLRKGSSMADGQVGFNDRKKVIQVRNVERKREVVNRLNKTKEEVFPDLPGERQQRDREVRAKAKARAKAAERDRKQETAQRQAKAAAHDYGNIMAEEDMESNADFAATEDTSAAVDFEDDFM